ncbi:MAG: cupredoxin domain-containing protein [Gammaproteobacteria bacterium]
MTPIIINLLGVMLIGLVIYWFWLSTPRKITTASKTTPIEIRVKDGVYTPAYIETKKGETIRLRFVREDPSPCAAKVIFNSLNKSLELPMHGSAEIELHPEEAGEIDFTCEMQMYRGRLSVR